jgi:hypothetical protein
MNNFTPRYFDRDGRELSKHEACDRNGVIKDGIVLRTRMQAMDAAPRPLLARDAGPMRVNPTGSAQRSASPYLLHVHDGTGDSGLAMHRPGFRVTDAPLSDELQRAREDYLKDLTTAWRGAGKEGIVPDAPKVSGNDATPVDDIESAYRLYAEEISQAWKTAK